MERNKVSLEKAASFVKNPECPQKELEYVLIYRSNGCELKKMAESKETFDEVFIESSYKEDENLEVRFFSPGHELHIFNTDTGPVAVDTTYDENDEYIEESYYLARDKDKKVMVCKLLDYDEDGQAYILKTCLKSLEV